MTISDIAPQSHSVPSLMDECSVQNASTSPAYESIVPGMMGTTAPMMPTTPQMMADMAKKVSNVYSSILRDGLLLSWEKLQKA